MAGKYILGLVIFHSLVQDVGHVPPEKKNFNVFKNLYMASSVCHVCIFLTVWTFNLLQSTIGSFEKEMHNRQANDRGSQGNKV